MSRSNCAPPARMRRSPRNFLCPALPFVRRAAGRRICLGCPPFFNRARICKRNKDRLPDRMVEECLSRSYYSISPEGGPPCLAVPRGVRQEKRSLIYAIRGIPEPSYQTNNINNNHAYRHDYGRIRKV